MLSLVTYATTSNITVFLHLVGQFNLNDDKPNDCTLFSIKGQTARMGWVEPKSKIIHNNGDINLLEAIRIHGAMIDEAYHTLLHLSADIHSAEFWCCK